MPPSDAWEEPGDREGSEPSVGTESAIGARVDPDLGTEEPGPKTRSPEPSPPSPSRSDDPEASAWRRLGAYVVDSILLTLPTNLLVELAFGRPVPTDIDFADPAASLELLWPFAALAFAVELVYFAGMEGSRLQATVGKHLLKIRVADEEGQPVSFLRAAGRNVGKLASALPFFLGFLMIFTSRRNQALHDHLANCLVLEGRPEEEPGGPNLEGQERRWDR